MDMLTSLPPLHGEGGAQRRVGSERTDLELDRMKKTAQDFEAGFLSMMLKPMFEGLSTDGMFGGGDAEATWRSFMVDAMARKTAQSGGVGLADVVMSEMIKMQEIGQ